MQVLARIHGLQHWLFLAALPFLAAPLRAEVVDPDDLPIASVTAPRLEAHPFYWHPLALGLPPSIEVYEGEAVNADGQPVRAWYASIDYNDKSLQARAILSRSTIGREAASLLAKSSGALVAVNGGYFDMKRVPAPTFSLVLSNGEILAKNVQSASRTNGKYSLTRGAFGIRTDRSFDVSWIAHFGDKIWSYPTPLPNTYQQPAPAPSMQSGQEWDALEGIGGAPVLMENGGIQLSSEAEAIPRDMSENRHPRTAIGWSALNRLILFVSDGRQPLWSMGLTLNELALTMRDLGCIEALNLDGGGSSTFVVKDRALNRPSDGQERNVTSIFGIVPGQTVPKP